MKTRIVIEKLNDGHIVIDKQQLSNAALSGNAHTRKLAKRALASGDMTQAWRRTDRNILRTGTVDATQLNGAAGIGVYIVPFGTDPEVKANAEENDSVAHWYGMDAAETVEAIEQYKETFKVSKPKRVVVTITEVE